MHLRTHAGTELKGSVLGVQKLYTGNNNKYIHIVLLCDEFAVRHVELLSVADIVVLNGAVRDKVQLSLGESLNAIQGKDLKTVVINAQGEGEREIVAIYAVECPVYKLTYRFLLGEGEEGQVYVQGWAIIDNPSEEDLNEVDVTIVSGMPISFEHDLYAARYVKRPEERIKTSAAYAAPSEATFGNTAQNVQRFQPPGEMPARSNQAKRLGLSSFEFGVEPASFGTRSQLVSAQPAAAAAAASSSRRQNRALTVDHFNQGAFGSSSALPPPVSLRPGEGQIQAAETVGLDDLFEYNIPTKITIKTGESALVPLISQPVEGGRVDIYSHATRAANPLSAVRVKNTTEATFEGGPASVFEHSRLVGELMMQSCRPNSEQFLPFSVDLDCNAEMTSEWRPDKTVSSTVVGANIKVTSSSEVVYKYIFHNNRVDDIDLYVLHKLEAEYEVDSASVVVSPKEGAAESSSQTPERTPVNVMPVHIEKEQARYKLTLPEWSRTELRVTQKKHAMRHYEIRSHCTQINIQVFRDNGIIEKAMEAKMREIMCLEREISEQRTKLKSYSDRKHMLEEDQERFRKNLESLGTLQSSAKFKDSPLIESYIQSLADSEQEIVETIGLFRETEQKVCDLEASIEAKVAVFGSS